MTGPIANPLNADPDIVARVLCDVALHGSIAILAACRHGRPAPDMKSDGTPVTAADLRADRAIRSRLRQCFPGTQVVSEEGAATAPAAPVFILVDPLDGTREFVSGGDNWCVAVALVADGRAIAGAIAAPRLNRAWFGARRAFACDLTPGCAMTAAPVPIRVDRPDPAGPVVLVSRFHGEGRSQRIVDRLHPSRQVEASSAVKFGLIAEGSADAYIRCGPTMEWDVAAGDAILTAAGGRVCDLHGADLRYGLKRGDYLNPPFVAAGSSSLAAAACDAAQRES